MLLVVAVIIVIAYAADQLRKAFDMLGGWRP